MTRKIFAALIVLICLVSTSAFARPGDEYRPFLTIGGGVSFMDDIKENHSTLLDHLKISADNGYNGFIAAGRAYDVGRVEFSLGYHSVDLDKAKFRTAGTTVDLDGDLQVAPLLVSIFWDFNTEGSVSPYFGGGIGVCHIRIDDDGLGADNRDNPFAYQLGLGLSFNLKENTKLDIGYKLLGVVEPNLGPLDPDYVLLHNGNAALRFLF